eukprot:TRINITY_DN5417_c1_g1_i1.p1 TRINITY_DN5417_c1_g1~~TRINITY_DN5417_c1_g1_i1.p1  ORF type:complete len:533 (+),score=159.21 TRINITY_DN5417_c1_g1_i1:1103-2701(+)
MNTTGLNWYTPPRLLLLFCVLNLLNHVERGNVGSLAVNGGFENVTCAKELCGGHDQPHRGSLSCRKLCGYTGFQGEFEIRNSQDGLLATFFTTGLLVGSPPAAQAIKYVHPFTVMAVGQTMFAAALLACGFAQSFPLLITYRFFAAAAEPTLTVIAPAYIVETAPPGRRAQWASLYYLCVPGGYALGYAFGGCFCDVCWRWSFRILAAISFPPAVFLAVAKRVDLRPKVTPLELKSFPLWREGSWLLVGPHPRNPPEQEDGAMGDALRSAHSPFIVAGELRRSRRSGGDSFKSAAAAAVAAGPPPTADARPTVPPDWLWDDPPTSFASDLRQILVPHYVLVVAGLACLNAVMGVLWYWGPKASAAMFPSCREHSDALFSAITACGGVVGTLVGACVLDARGGGFRNGALLCGIASVLGFFTVGAGLWMPPDQPSPYGFFGLLCIGLGCLFAMATPASAAVLFAVPVEVRPTAVAMSFFGRHAFGDLTSPLYSGAIQDAVGDWRVTFSCCVPLLLAGAALFACALCVHRPIRG